jgi:hypothetical protein
MPSIQYWFTGAAFGAFLALLFAIPTLGYGWYRAAITEMESAKNKLESSALRLQTQRMKDLLGKAIVSGGRLIEEQKDKEEQQTEKDASVWVEKTKELIAAAYGDGEAALFLDDSGYVFYGDGSRKSNIRNWIDGRMRRISELLRRADSLAVRKEFDPVKFD